MNAKDIGLRLFWTVVAAVLGTLTADQLLAMDLEAIKAAGTVGFIAGFNLISLLLRSEASKYVDKK